MKKHADINKVAVIGAGLMGYGIGVDFARAGYETWMYNTREETSRQAMQRAKDAFELFVEAQLMTPSEADAACARLHPTTSMEAAAANVDYVSENALESLPLKRQIFADLDRLCPPTAILTTNSSSYTTTAIVKDNKMEYPERCCVAHYFQPPHLLPLVEVVAGEKTAKETIAKTCEILSGMHKKAVVIPVEVPGHAGNRIQGAIGREIRYLVDNNICTPEMIDDIIMYSFGRRMANTGWFIRNDLIGLDFSYNAAKSAGAEPWGPFKERVERGETGMKSGKGFYEWPDFGKAVERRQNMDLLRFLKRDMEDGKP
ncbi:MAG: 3-hydroxyacyl-CoA dehydrogenase family protein [Deltaproteobacteria bacterium]|nr:3-hydroxyacyl-CoA dehydrogenase family protein [Deltaproteobacteria bacterium]